MAFGIWRSETTVVAVARCELSRRVTLTLDRIRRAKWALWHGQAWKTQAYLEDLCGWCHAKRAQTPRTLAQELWAYLETNRDSLPNYGIRYRAQACPSRAAFTESAVNEIVAKRMNKSQPMRTEPLRRESRS